VAQLFDVVLAESTGTDDGMDPMHCQPRQSDTGGVGDGEVDDDIALGLGERPQFGLDRHTTADLAGRSIADGCNQLERRIGSDGGTRYGPHPTAGTVDSDSDGATRHGVERTRRLRWRRAPGPSVTLMTGSAP
jgi:hypothetical protein